MVTLGSKRIHIAFTDSRGEGVLKATRNLNTTGECFDLQVYKGATLEELVSVAEGYLPRHDFDVVYIAGGANNITYKDRSTNRIYFTWGHGDNLKNYLVKVLTEADQRFSKKFPASKVIFCPLIGSELKRVVNAHPTSQGEQEAVEEAVWEFNSQVFKINNRRGVMTPSLHHQVHRMCKGKRCTCYHHLADGIHLTEDLKLKWAKQFVKAIAHN